MAWQLNDIQWGAFKKDQVPFSLVPLIKAASLVEYNALDYGRYLKSIFPPEEPFFSFIDPWVEEERNHGRALARWVSYVDPAFDLETSLLRFQSIFRIPFEAEVSVRGSNTGELIARCIVETGTSSLYSALAETVHEPVLKEICRRIASDEWRHFKAFYAHLKRHLEDHPLSRLQRLRIAYQRIQESESDELASAYYAANISPREAYHHRKFVRLCLGQILPLYKRHHLHKVCQMVSKAAGLSPQGVWIKPASYLFTKMLHLKGAFFRWKTGTS